MSDKKPSERIEELRQELISRDWVSGGGNRYGLDAWEEMHRENPVYSLRAIVAYLDECASAQSAHTLELLTDPSALDISAHYPAPPRCTCDDDPNSVTPCPACTPGDADA